MLIFLLVNAECLRPLMQFCRADKADALLQGNAMMLDLSPQKSRAICTLMHHVMRDLYRSCSGVV